MKCGCRGVIDQGRNIVDWEAEIFRYRFDMTSEEIHQFRINIAGMGRSYTTGYRV